MCGLAVIDADLIGTANKRINALVRQNLDRGDFGFGYLGLTDAAEGAEIIGRSTSHFTEIEVPATFIAAHTRAPIGKDIGIMGVHPIDTGRFLLAHNGTITLLPNDMPGHMSFYSEKLDTAALAEVIHRRCCRPAADLVWAELLNILIDDDMIGQHACWLFDRLERRFFFWRHQAPLFMQLHAPDTMFSLCSTRGEANADAVTVPEGVLYEYRFQEGELATAGTFPVKATYYIP